MKCPKCAGEMSPIQYLDVEVDRCTDCKGIFFDAREHIVLKDIQGSGAIDVGNPSTGEMYNKMKDVLCPRCSVKMVQFRDEEQHHIVLDACPECLGVYFDAGEFKDFKHHTLIDYIKDFFSRRKNK